MDDSAPRDYQEHVVESIADVVDSDVGIRCAGDVFADAIFIAGGKWHRRERPRPSASG
jgi:hypothetical protein